jgi:hypothetical protein
MLGHTLNDWKQRRWHLQLLGKCFTGLATMDYAWGGLKMMAWSLLAYGCG